MKKDIAESLSLCYSYFKEIGNVTDNGTDNGAGIDSKKWVQLVQRIR